MIKPKFGTRFFKRGEPKLEAPFREQHPKAWKYARIFLGTTIGTAVIINVLIVYLFFTTVHLKWQNPFRSPVIIERNK